MSTYCLCSIALFFSALVISLEHGSILHRSRQGDISPVVMGSRGRAFFSEVFLGSVSHNVARHAPVPTLLIPAIRSGGAA